MKILLLSQKKIIGCLIVGDRDMDFVHVRSRRSNFHHYRTGSINVSSQIFGSPVGWQMWAYNLNEEWDKQHPCLEDGGLSNF